MRVLVLDGNENQAVACVRSLARAGHRVEVGADSSWSKAGLSRHARGTFRYPAPQEDAQAFVRAVAEQAAREPGTFVLPMTERATLPLSLERERIAAVGGRMVLPSHDILERAFDKRETTRLAESLGIAVPRSVTLRTAADARAFADAAVYPVVLKPTASEEMTADGATRSTGGPTYARSRAEFDGALAALRLRTSRDVLAQEFVEGRGAGWFALMHHGELRAEFAHRRIRDVRPTGSGSALRESVRPDPRVRDAGLRILQALGWHGVAMVEFRVRADGSPVFLEVNGRFWNSLALAIHAGADFPAMLAEMAERGDASPRPPFREGVRCRWFLGDVRHLLAVMKGPPRGFPGEFPGRLSTLARFLTPVPGTMHDNFSLDDPLPELGDWADFLGRRIPGLLARKRRQAAGASAEPGAVGGGGR